MKCKVCGGDCEVYNNHWQCKCCDNVEIEEYLPQQEELKDIAEIDSLFDSFKYSDARYLLEKNLLKKYPNSFRVYERLFKCDMFDKKTSISKEDVENNYNYNMAISLMSDTDRIRFKELAKSYYLHINIRKNMKEFNKIQKSIDKLSIKYPCYVADVLCSYTRAFSNCFIDKFSELKPILLKIENLLIKSAPPYEILNMLFIDIGRPVQYDWYKSDLEENIRRLGREYRRGNVYDDICKKIYSELLDNLHNLIQNDIAKNEIIKETRKSESLALNDLEEYENRLNVAKEKAVATLETQKSINEKYAELLDTNNQLKKEIDNFSIMKINYSEYLKASRQVKTLVSTGAITVEPAENETPTKESAIENRMLHARKYLEKLFRYKCGLARSCQLGNGSFRSKLKSKENCWKELREDERLIDLVSDCYGVTSTYLHDNVYDNTSDKDIVMVEKIEDLEKKYPIIPDCDQFKTYIVNAQNLLKKNLERCFGSGDARAKLLYDSLIKIWPEGKDFLNGQKSMKNDAFLGKFVYFIEDLLIVYQVAITKYPQLLEDKDIDSNLTGMVEFNEKDKCTSSNVVKSYAADKIYNYISNIYNKSQNKG